VGDSDSAQLPDTKPAGPAPASYSSVVYFHGMGSQRRYEETSRLIDSIDRYLVRQHRSGHVDRSFQLWNVLNLSVWFDHWIAGQDVALV